MGENYHYYHQQQQQQQQQQQPLQEKAGRPSRLGLRSTGGGGQIVEVQGGHIVRSTGRKDRHSKVCTAKGPRDRRVRLSAHTAIQFYDVQDRLGYDRPSKAVDWLIKKAKASIDELAELPAWKPTADSVNFEQNPNNENLNNRRLDCLEEHHDDEIADNQLGNTQNPSFLLLPTSLDSNSVSDTMKSFFPMGASSTPPPQFPHDFPPSEMPLRTTSQNQDLNLSLQSLQGPILQQQQPPPTEQGNNIFFDGSGWPENGGFQRLVAWGGGGTGGDAFPSGFAFNSPPFLQPLFGQTTNNQLLNYISQRGPLQSSNTPPVRAWVDTQPFNGMTVDQHQALAFHHPASMPGYTSGFSGFHIPARIQGDEEEHDGIADKPSSASSDSRH